MSDSIAQVQFHGDTLDAVREGDAVWVSLRRLCENLGLDTATQWRKLMGKSWATIVEKTMVAGDGKDRALSMLNLDAVPMWLATVDPRKVKEQVREKLAVYQKECAKALADHFFGRQPAATGLAVLGLVRELRAMLAEERSRSADLMDRVAALEQRPATLPFPVPALPRTTVQERVKFKNWFGTSAKQRNQIRRQANLWLDLRYNETPDVSGGPGGPCVYHGHQIAILDEAIDRVREAYLERDRRTGGLFRNAG